MVRGTERKLIKMFRALAMKEEEAVIPTRRYLSRPRLALGCVRTAFSLLGFRMLLTNANRRSGQFSQIGLGYGPRLGQAGAIASRLDPLDFGAWRALRSFECTDLLGKQGIFR